MFLFCQSGHLTIPSGLLTEHGVHREQGAGMLRDEYEY
jgi:hypothetical protein